MRSVQWETAGSGRELRAVFDTDLPVRSRNCFTSGFMKSLIIAPELLEKPNRHALVININLFSPIFQSFLLLFAALLHSNPSTFSWRVVANRHWRRFWRRLISPGATITTPTGRSESFYGRSLPRLLHQKVSLLGMGMRRDPLIRNWSLPWMSCSWRRTLGSSIYKLMIKEDQLATECRKSSRPEEAFNSTTAQLSLANTKIAGTFCLSESTSLFDLPSICSWHLSSAFIFLKN